MFQPVMTTIESSNESQMLNEEKLQFFMWWDMIQLENIKNKLIMIEKGNQLPSLKSNYRGQKSWVVLASERSH